MKDLFASPAPKPQVINLKSFNIDSTKWRAESLQSDSDKWTNAAMETFWYAVWFLDFAGFFPVIKAKWQTTGSTTHGVPKPEATKEKDFTSCS